MSHSKCEECIQDLLRKEREYHGKLNYFKHIHSHIQKDVLLLQHLH